MSNTVKLFVYFIGLVIIGLVFVAIPYISAANYGNSQEFALKAQYDDNQNVLATYTTKITEMAQVPAKYKSDLSDIVKQTFEGRYGSDGSKAMVQFIKENNMNLDPGMYKRLMDVMESGRNEFSNSQTRLIDMKRSYETSLGSVWQGYWLHMAGYPKIDLNKYKPVINAHTDEAFTTKRDEGVKI